MGRRFNITGTCIPEKHYFADISKKLDRIIEMVSHGDYFTINRPRQYGKTTVMYFLSRRMHKSKDYLLLDISFEGIDTPSYASYERFIQVLFSLMEQRLTFEGETKLAELIKAQKNLKDFNSLNNFITTFARECPRKIVLMIDEVDKSCNNQLFLDFLGMLRTKYLAQNQGRDFSFYSVILAGVHDVKTLKTKLRPNEDSKYNSPWNIAVDFDVDLSLFPQEIQTMLADYVKEQDVQMEITDIANKLFYFTSGYPFLVSFLCKIVDEEILPNKEKRTWDIQDIETAVQRALKKDNTNSRSLIKNLEENPQLYDFVFSIIMNEYEFSFTRDNPLIDYGVVYGILKEEGGKTRIHNRIYEERIFNYMTSKLETSGKTGFYNITENFLDDEGQLNVQLIIRKFQEFMKEQYNSRDRSFIERNARLLFLAFIKPIINGNGFDFKEVQISEEKRLDIVITFGNQKFIVELKIWRGDTYHQKGLEQLTHYLDAQNQDKGYLLIFDLRKECHHIGETQTITHSDKTIFIAWV